jgi:hypothetical protein
MATTTPYVPPIPSAPPGYSQTWGKTLGNILNSVVGKTNNGTTLTLNANAGSTVLTDPRLFVNSVLAFMPQTAHAAAALTSLYVATQTKGTATISHPNDANTDKTYRIAILG